MACMCTAQRQKTVLLVTVTVKLCGEAAEKCPEAERQLAATAVFVSALNCIIRRIKVGDKVTWMPFNPSSKLIVGLYTGRGL